MPPRLESELDPVTLHNMALLTADANPSESFDKLQFLLLQQVTQMQQQLENPESRLTGAGPLVCPPETFANLLLLYCKYEYFDLAADLMAEHADLTYKHLSPVNNHFSCALRSLDVNELRSLFSTCLIFSRRSSLSKRHRKRHSPSLMPFVFDTGRRFDVRVRTWKKLGDSRVRMPSVQLGSRMNKPWRRKYQRFRLTLYFHY